MRNDFFTHNEIDLGRLADYFAEELAPEEMRTVERWIAADPTRTELVWRLRKKWEHTAPRPYESIDVERAWHIMRGHMTPSQAADTISISAKNRLSMPPSDGSDVERPERGGSWNTWRQRGGWMRAAGIACAGIVAATLLLVFGERLSTYRIDANLASQASVYTTPNGQRSSITLPDGSTVVLNVASRLEVPSNYAAGHRNVQLSGEALFIVEHNDNAPFLVNAGPSRTRVLGTRFVVRHYPGDSAATIAVRDGKVAVGTTVVTASEQVTVTSLGVSTLQHADARRFEFSRGVLWLSSMPLTDAIPELNRWYDVDIRLGDTVLTTQRIAGGFKAGSSTDVMSMLELTLNVRVVRKGRILTLYPKE